MLANVEIHVWDETRGSGLGRGGEEERGAMGFSIGRSSPNVFYHWEWDAWCFVHGDDIFSSGPTACLEKMKVELEKNFMVKTTTIGPGLGQAREARILNRLITWFPNRGVSYEAGPRHIGRIIQDAGIDAAKTLTAPGAKVYDDDHKGRHHLASKISSATGTTGRHGITMLDELLPEHDDGDVDYDRYRESEQERGRDLLQIKSGVSCRSQWLASRSYSMQLIRRSSDQ